MGRAFHFRTQKSLISPLSASLRPLSSPHARRAALESVKLILLKPALLQIRQASELDHGRRAAHQNLNSGRRRGQTLVDHLLADEARVAGPGGGGFVEGVGEEEAGGVIFLELFKLRVLRVLERRLSICILLLLNDALLSHLLAAKNVPLRLVGEQQMHGSRTVVHVAEDSLDDLQHGREAGAAGDHAEARERRGGTIVLERAGHKN